MSRFLLAGQEDLDVPSPKPQDVLRTYEPANDASQEVLPMRTVLIVLLLLLLIGALPTWPYSSGWGYYPSGGLVVLLIIILLLAKGK